MAEERQEEDPNDYEEHKDQDGNCPSWHILRAPEICPISTIRRGEEVILEDDCDEEPANDSTAEESMIEVGDFAWSLAVV